MIKTVQERFAGLPVVAIGDCLELGLGSIRDYQALSGYHYKAGKPATASRVLVLRHGRASVCDRYRGCQGVGRVVGVLVESWPVLDCRQRGWALRGRYSGLGDTVSRGGAVNTEVRCISRVVIHPQWRGLGLAVRLVKAALVEPTTIFTEALAAMGRVHPFFERAGMTAYHQPPAEHDSRLIAVLASVGIEGVGLAGLEQIWGRIRALPGARERWVLGELDRWSSRALGRKSGRCTDPHEQLQLAQRRLLCEPVYYLKDNRDGAGVAGDLAAR